MTTPRFVAQPFFAPPTDELRFLPEGPRVLQHPPGGRPLLGWVAIQYAADQPVGSLNFLDLVSRENRTIALPGRPGFFAETTRPGVVLIGLERRLIRCDLASGDWEETGVALEDDERVIINDGLAVEGGILFGTKHLGFELPIAALHYFDAATRAVHPVLEGQTCSNGKHLWRDADGAALVDIDSQPKSLACFRLDAALRQVHAKRVLVEPARMPGFPDGLRPAPDGKSVIVAFFNPHHASDGVAQQFCLDSGEVLAEWRLPGSPRVTCPEFVRIDGEVKLLFTTAVEGMPAETRAIAPGAGSLYVADTHFTVMPSPPPLVPFP